MAKDIYITASLDDEKVEEIGKIIANPTSRRIINLLAEKNATETEIAEELSLPLSTVNYNMQQLQKAGIVETNKFYYSKKGNKIQVYTLARKIILIAAKGISMHKGRLKGILSAVFASFAISILIKIFFSNLYIVKELATDKAATGIKEVAGAVAQQFSKPVITTQIPNIQLIGTNYALFFFLGSMIALLIFLIAEQIIRKRHRIISR